MSNEKNTAPGNTEIIKGVTLPMPGTVGGAKIVFKEDIDPATSEEDEAFNELNAKLNKQK